MITGLAALAALKDAKMIRYEKDENLVLIDIDYFNQCSNAIEVALKKQKKKIKFN